MHQAAGTAIVRKASIEELCNHRARALQLYAEVVEKWAEAKAAHARACIGTGSINPPALDTLKYFADRFEADAREHIDRDMWRAFLVNTPLGSLMDLEERKKFEEALKKPAECTPETVFATMDRLRGEAGLIFRRGLVNAFASLSREYRSHDGFKVGPRMVLDHILTVDRLAGSRRIWARTNHYAEERLRDLDRVFHVLDGEPAPEYSQGLCAAIREAVRTDLEIREVETPYFRAKLFKNGNAHLYFLRDDLVRRANLLIAEHYGAVVGAAPEVAPKRRGTAPPAEPCLSDFFETPRELAQRMVDEAEIAPGHRVMEPSAGEGAIVRAIMAQHGRLVEMIEAHPGRAEALRRDFLGMNVDQANFLEVTPAPEFDRVIMNPPFSHGLDILHVEHALDFLAPGGRLVAIMSNGITFRSDEPTRRLRARLEAMGAGITRLPEGTFKSAGTGVNTVLVVVDKEG